jgi:hypothetical protein
MKQKLLTRIAIGVGILACSCSNFLDKSPTGVEKEASFFKTADQCNRAVIAAYDIHAWSGNGFTDTYLWMVGDILSDDAHKGGESPADMGFLQQLKEFNGSADNDISLQIWRQSYQGIFRANLVIKNVPDAPVTSDFTQAMHDQYVAEATFLRGHFYFLLTTFFGEVPLVTEIMAPGSTKQKKATQAEVWAQIESDFTAAAAVLPVKHADGDVGRATKGAAKAYLAKTYIYQAKFAAALPVAKEVEALGIYALENNFAKIFSEDGKNGVESVYEIQHMRGPNNGWGNANEGETTGDFQGNRDGGYASGWGFNNPDSAWVATGYVDGDLRKAASVYTAGDTLNKGTSCEEIVKREKYWAGPYKNKKYLHECFARAMVPEMSNWPKSKRLIRYADVLLFIAEAANETGDMATATTYLTKVRDRAFGGAGKAPAVVAADQITLRHAIWDERRRELLCEGHRFFDLVRMQLVEADVAEKALTKPAGGAELYPITFKKTKSHLPIPQAELDIDPNLTQNEYFN